MSFWKSLFGSKDEPPRRAQPLTRDEAIAALYQCVQTRPRPEDVAELVLEVLEGQLTEAERGVLRKAAKNSLKQNAWGYSSMAADFLRPVGAERQARKAQELFSVSEPLSAADCLHPSMVEAFLSTISKQVSYSVGHSNFKADRLNRVARKVAGMDIKKRQYNKRWRFLKRLEAKIGRMVRSQRKYNFTRYSKSALAVQLTQDDLARDLATACFIAYLSARMSVRVVARLETRNFGRRDGSQRFFDFDFASVGSGVFGSRERSSA